MKMMFQLTFVWLLAALLLLQSYDCYKLAFNNGRDLLKIESNKFVNGKRVDEPKAEEAIDALTGLGFDVVNVENGTNETVAPVSLKAASRGGEESIRKLSGKRYEKSELEFRKKANVGDIFKNFMRPDHEYLKGLPAEYDPKTLTQNVIELDSAKYGTFDIFITNINENESDRDGKKGEEEDAEVLKNKKKV